MAMQRKIKKFYKVVSVEERDALHVILLDGRNAKTKAGNLLGAPTPTLANAIAREWEGEGEFVDFNAVPLTKLASTALDLGPRDRSAWIEEVGTYLASDLLCYRADGPQALVTRQERAWSPMLAWAQAKWGPLEVACSVIAIDQPSATLAALAQELREADDWSLIGIRSAAQISGSAVLALALFTGAFDASDLFAASRIDERYQAELWGEDLEAADRERALEADFTTLAKWFGLLRT
jgi:chaperone required for assembly of F1-ATPase